MEIDLNQGVIAHLISACSAHHRHLCPRQVLGLRIGLAGAARLGLETPREDKRLLVIVETDGCFVDGISVASGCTVGHRTLRLEDCGKVAATFVDVLSGEAFRIAPRLDVRQRAWSFAPGETRRYFAQLQAYPIMPDDELMSMEEVQLATPVQTLISRPGLRVNCVECGEEIINKREIYIDDAAFCRACAGQPYYLQKVPQLATFKMGFANINWPPANPGE